MTSVSFPCFGLAGPPSYTPTPDDVGKSISVWGNCFFVGGSPVSTGRDAAEHDQAIDFAKGSEESAEIELPSWLQLKVEPAPPEKRAARCSDRITVAISFEDYFGEWLAERNYVRPDDEPGIAAMDAKNAQAPAPSTIYFRGEKVDADELAAALALIRKAPEPVNTTPRGLLMVAPIDHRCGRWSQE
jgi:hypothetical protein